jgi:hypothetical protein
VNPHSGAQGGSEINPRLVKGELLGESFPTSIESLLELGPAFLTQAMRVSGALTADNEVVAIDASREFHAGGMGRKLVLTVRYLRSEAGLSTELFAKFPRDFGDPLRELFAPLMAPEVRFALLSRRKDFPIAVPRCYFAEFDSASGSGILICERIAYGEAGIQPAFHKCMDYELKNPLRYYRALATSLARLAGRFKSGTLGPEFGEQFPWFPSMRAIPYGMHELRRKFEVLRDFVSQGPHLFPDDLGARADLDRFSSEAELMLQHQEQIVAHLNAQSDLITFCHLNTNVDNAWFWTDPRGDLQAGLLDWGGVGQMHLATAFYGLICSAEIDFLKQHRHELVSLVKAEYEACGGPRTPLDTFARSVKLACGLMGLAWMMDAPALVAASIPDYRTIKSRFDQKLQSNFLARVQLQPLIVLMNEWRDQDIASAVREILSEPELA